MTVTFYLTLVVFLGLCAVFALLILIQKGRGGGISSAFGGAGGNTAFGSKTGDVLTWATSVVFFLFLIFCVGLNLMAARVNAVQTGAAAGGPGAREAEPTAAEAPAPPTSAAPTTAPANDVAPTTQATPSRPGDTARLPNPVLPPAEQPIPAPPTTRP